MFYTALFLVSLLGLGIAFYTDLKKRIVPNKLNLSLIVLGVVLHTANTIISRDYWFLFTYALVVAGAFAFSWLLWKLGAWAGGDAKLFTALAALNPLNPYTLNTLLGLNIYQTTLPLFPLTLFVWALAAMLPYGAFLTVKALAKNKKARREISKELGKKALETGKYCAALIGFKALLEFMGLSLWLLLPILFAIPLIKHWTKWFTVAGVFLWALLEQPANIAVEYVYLFIALYSLYLLLKLYSASKKYALRSKVRVKSLKEGDIPSNSIYLYKGKAIMKEGLNMKKVLKHLMHREIGKALEQARPRGRLVASATRAAGLTIEQAKEVKRLAEKGLIPKSIEVKKSSAFVPAMTLGYVMANAFGDIIWLLL